MCLTKSKQASTGIAAGIWMWWLFLNCTPNSADIITTCVHIFALIFTNSSLQDQ